MKICIFHYEHKSRRLNTKLSKSVLPQNRTYFYDVFFSSGSTYGESFECHHNNTIKNRSYGSLYSRLDSNKKYKSDSSPVISVADNNNTMGEKNCTLKTYHIRAKQKKKTKYNQVKILATLPFFCGLTPPDTLDQFHFHF